MGRIPVGYRHAEATARENDDFDGEFASAAPTRWSSGAWLALAVMLVVAVVAAFLYLRGSEDHEFPGSAHDAGSAAAADLPTRVEVSLMGSLPLSAKAEPLFVGNRDFKQLPASDIAEAAFVYQDATGVDGHRWRLYVGRGVDPIADEGSACFDHPAVVSCSVSSTADGALLVNRVVVSTYNEEIQNWQVGDVNKLEGGDLSNVRIERALSVYRGQDKTSIVETVEAPPSLSPDEGFATSPDDWVDVLNDTALRLND